MVEKEKGSSFYVYYLTCFATIGGLLIGYHTGIISGALLLIGDLRNPETIWKEAKGAAVVFALLAGYLTDLLGRKKVIMLASFVFTAGAIIMAADNGTVVLLVGRLIVGIGIAGGRLAIVRVFTTQPVTRSFILGCTLQILQPLCGINAVIYYSVNILKRAGFPKEMAIWSVCVPNAVNCLATFIGVCLVEKMGRRILTLISLLGVMISLVVLAVGFQLSSIYTPSIGTNAIDILDENASNQTCAIYISCDACVDDNFCGFCYEDGMPLTTGTCLGVDATCPESYAWSSYRCNRTNADIKSSKRKFHWSISHCPSDYAWMALLSLAMFVLVFAPGLGPMPWTINSEIYPLWARSTCVSLATMTNWVFNLIVSLTLLTLTEKNYQLWYNLAFCGISLLGFIWLFFMLPETKNKTLEEVEELFMSEEYKKSHRQDKFLNGTKGTTKQAHSTNEVISDSFKQDHQYSVMSNLATSKF